MLYIVLLIIATALAFAEAVRAPSYFPFSYGWTAIAFYFIALLVTHV
jgi:hypothetical protein